MGLTGSLVAGAVVAGGAVQALGQVQAGRAEQRAFEYNADIQRENARIARETAAANAVFAEENARFAEFGAEASTARADAALRRGAQEEIAHRLAVKQLMGRQRAVLAAQGQDIGDDSGLDILIDTAELGETDAIIIRNNAALEAWGYEVESFGQRVRAYNERVRGFNVLEAGRMDERNFLAAATNYEYQGDLARRAGESRALGTLLSAGASAYRIRQGIPGRTPADTDVRAAGRTPNLYIRGGR